MSKNSGGWIKKLILFLWDDRFKFESDLEVSRKLMMLNYVVLATVFFLIPYGILSLINKNYLIGALDLITAVIIFSAIYYYKKTQNYNFLTYSIINVLGLLFLYLLYSTGVDLTGPFWSLVFPVAVMFMLGKRTGAIFSWIYLFIASLIIFHFSNNELYTTSFNLRFMGAFLAVGIISYYVEYIREVMHYQLRKNNRDLQSSISTLKKQEEAIAEKEKYFRTLFEASSDSIFLMTGEYFTECNPKTLEMFGCKKEDIINQSPIKFSPEFQPDGTPSEIRAKDKIDAALSGKPQFFEWVHKKLDGTNFHAEVSLNQIHVSKQRLLLASVRDITSRKMVEHELVYAKDQAEKSERMKSDFLAQMSHEIRTPINTIMSYSSLLKMEFGKELKGDMIDSFKSIENAAIRLLRTIDLILNISDVEAGTYEPKYEMLDFEKQILIPVVKEFKQAAENNNLQLNYSKDFNDAPIITVDNYTVYQAIANLIDNAVKYTNEGKISVDLEKTNKHFIVKIIDTGIGISKEYIPNLFEKFSQEEAGYTRKYEGSGLGMALVKKYCEINGMDIHVESSKGIGSKFILEIPLTNRKLQ